MHCDSVKQMSNCWHTISRMPIKYIYANIMVIACANSANAFPQIKKPSRLPAACHAFQIMIMAKSSNSPADHLESYVCGTNPSVQSMALAQDWAATQDMPSTNMSLQYSNIKPGDEPEPYPPAFVRKWMFWCSPKYSKAEPAELYTSCQLAAPTVDTLWRRLQGSTSRGPRIQLKHLKPQWCFWFQPEAIHPLKGASRCKRHLRQQWKFL